MYPPSCSARPTSPMPLSRSTRNPIAPLNESSGLYALTGTTVNLVAGQ